MGDALVRQRPSDSHIRLERAATSNISAMPAFVGVSAFERAEVELSLLQFALADDGHLRRPHRRRGRVVGWRACTVAVAAARLFPPLLEVLVRQ